MGMTLTKSFVNNCRNIGALRDFLCQAMDQVDEKDKEIAELKEQYKDMDVIHTVHIAKMNAKIDELESALESERDSRYADSVDAGMRERRLRRAFWLARAERYKIKEFLAREEGNLSNQMSWSRILRERTYNQWVDQLLRIANLANKLQNKCLAKAEEYK